VALQLHADRELGRDVAYYLARMGPVSRPEAPLEELDQRLRAPGAGPEILGYEQYARLAARMAQWPPEARAAAAVVVVPRRKLVVFLPGPFRPGATAAQRAQ
jgi:hypothetical protein